DVSPSRDEFHALARDRAVVAVTTRLLADAETPIGVYRKLGGGPGTFLLESAEQGRVWARYSFVGARAAATLVARDGGATWHGDVPPTVPRAGEPLAVLRATLEALATPDVSGMPPLTAGLVGYLSYDVVRRLERIPSLARDDLGLPELAFQLSTDLAVLDHDDGSLLLVANAFPTRERPAAELDAAYDAAVARLDVMTTALAQPAPATLARLPATEAPRAPAVRAPRGGFRGAVEWAKEQIRAGEVFQVVLSQRFEVATDADALDVYRALRVVNPSPYMYLLRFDGYDVVGSSPEALVKVQGERALVHPIAGTRPRGRAPDEDARYAAELRADAKERAEHVMLVDLARNDLGRVCVPGTVDVVDLMSVERYSHVMHLVSTVVGTLADGCTALDALLACFPAGTLTGAPKPRAMELIEEVEPLRRGIYGGAIGYLGLGGAADTAIAIRTGVIRDGVAYVQAGAGIVADSDPVAEEQETSAKASAVLSAVRRATQLRE
ncbi:MAG: anthranilate synthase component I, partial [Frankia sp.]|nr:anthranilate synthase component I [Frankia sp.]